MEQSGWLAWPVRPASCTVPVPRNMSVLLTPPLGEGSPVVKLNDAICDFLESPRRRIVDTRLEHQLVRTRLISSHTAELAELRITMGTMGTMWTLEDRDTLEEGPEGAWQKRAW